MLNTDTQLGKNRQLVSNKLVEFKKNSVEVRNQDNYRSLSRIKNNILLIQKGNPEYVIK